MNRSTLSTAALLTLAGLASAQTAGDILFVANQSGRTAQTEPDFIGFIPGAGGAQTTLYTAPTTDVNFRHVNFFNGQYYFSDATAFPSTSTTGAIFTVDSLFSGAGTRSDLATAGLVNSPFDLSYHAPSNSAIVVNNPSGTGIFDNPEDGITAVNLGSGATQQLFQEPVPMPGEAERYDGGTDIVADPARPGSYYVLTVNEGVGPGNADGAPSVLFRLTVSDDLTTSTVELVQDFSASETGIDAITFATGLTVGPNGNVFVTSGNSESVIYEVGIDGAGNSTGVSEFADIQAMQTAMGLEFGTVEEIEYDPFNQRFVLAERTRNNDPGLSRISEIGLDGLGYSELATGFAVNDIIIIPTPGAASMLALAGLAAVRRRRSA